VYTAHTHILGALTHFSRFCISAVSTRSIFEDFLFIFALSPQVIIASASVVMQTKALKYSIEASSIKTGVETTRSHLAD